MVKEIGRRTVLLVGQDFGFRWRSGVNVPYRIAKPLRPSLVGVGFEKPEIVVDRARNDVEIKSLRRCRLLEHEQGETLRTSVSQPLSNRKAVALRFRDFLAVLVKEELVVKSGGRLRPQNPRNPRRQLDRVR